MRSIKTPGLLFPQSLWKNRELLWRLTEREILGRYRGSALGIGWSFITPLCMLAVYTFVFSQVFKARWGGIEQSGPISFAINLFAGLIVFNLFSECASRAATLITSNPNYVKKVVFPLEVLGAVAVGSAAFHAIVSLTILLTVQLLYYHMLSASVLWLPLAWLPLILGSLACTWIASAAGVFLRDIGQVIGLGLNMLMFLSPVFFPISSLPTQWRPYLSWNPIAQVIEQTRLVLLNNSPPSYRYLLIGTIVTTLACELSFRAFQKSKRAFSDVL
jgi:lipopolysaccharide transport system permease protein